MNNTTKIERCRLCIDSNLVDNHQKDTENDPRKSLTRIVGVRGQCGKPFDVVCVPLVNQTIALRNVVA